MEIMTEEQYILFVIICVVVVGTYLWLTRDKQ